MTQRHLLWTHIATTGLDPVHDYILELYMKVTDMRGLDVGSERTFYSGLPAYLPPDGVARLNTADSLRIHARSGLLTDYQQQRQKVFINLDNDVTDCLKQLGGEIILAGYAPRFVYEFLRYAAPLAHQRLHFQQVDVTAIETFMDTAFEMNVSPRPGALRVRAKVDAAIQQYQIYLGVLGQLKP